MKNVLKSENVQLGITVTPEQYEILKSLSNEQGLPMSVILRRALILFLRQVQNDESPLYIL